MAKMVISRLVGMESEMIRVGRKSLRKNQSTKKAKKAPMMPELFKPFTADYLNVAPDIAEKNVSTINLLAEKLMKFPGYQIRMVGHAVMVNWDNPALGKTEQEKELLPLSKARAAAIMQALETRGIESARMVTDGVGASDQIVPDSDLPNRWKNRRVEFFLQKK